MSPRSRRLHLDKTYRGQATHSSAGTPWRKLSLLSAVALRSAICRVIDGSRPYDDLLGASGGLEFDGGPPRVISLGEVAARSGGAPQRSGRHLLFLDDELREHLGGDERVLEALLCCCHRPRKARDRSPSLPRHSAWPRAADHAPPVLYAMPNVVSHSEPSQRRNSAERISDRARLAARPAQ